MASEAEGETGNWDNRYRLDGLIEDGRLPREEHLRPLSRYWLRVFFGEAKLGGFKPSRDLDSMIRIRIAEIDEALSRQVDAILHAPEFQRLEASWRGLEFLLDRTAPHHDVIVRVLDASKEELSGDLRIFESPLNSAVARKILSVDWWHNGRPFSLLIGDYNCNPSEADVGLLADMAAIAERARAPFLSSAGPEFFCLEPPLCFGMFKPRLEHLFYDPVYRRWKEFRASAVSTHCALVTPRMLLREPYHCVGGHDQEQFPYHEPVSDWDSAAYLWGNAAYALAVCLARAYVKHGWAVDLHGIETGGLLDGLPVNRFLSMNGDQIQRGPAEAPLSDTQDRELRKQGFAPLCGSKRTAAAVFFGVPSCAKPRIYADQSATERAEYSIQLEAAFALARFLQFLVVICHRLPMSLSHQAIGSILANWLAQYVDEDEPNPKDEVAKPLRKGEVKVSAVAGVPNAMELTLSIEPRLSGAAQAPLTASVMVRPGESGGWAI